ncbi:MAG: 1-(5-phosphoribosyl)-5-[(5-phosphoribosylamino)methylideneamino]imidazole-4-carboxamide isomerase [Armatimonadetes bacterium]|nr:1-(5-phosphoribosyl)-5-[(5-phosphoribosylamino)methylideneamino]imidazole-4-carboxamide isomerase [Armatimonadota bacterium]
MIVIPAIDLSQGQCVRVVQGDLRRKTVYSDDPAAMARRWTDEGARIIHVVDLDGAVSGMRANAESLRAICRATEVPVEIGGGIRTVEDIETVLGLGARWAIIGTAALRDPEMVHAAVDRWGERIVVGIDGREGKAAVQGWTELTERSMVDAAEEMAAMGVARLIVTDIATDGMLRGPNLATIGAVAEAVSCEVTASGGIASLTDIESVARTLGPVGVTGCIVGKALYEGKFTLLEATGARWRSDHGTEPLRAARR